MYCTEQVGTLGGGIDSSLHSPLGEWRGADEAIQANHEPLTSMPNGVSN
jgi:hypothetical protein